MLLVVKVFKKLALTWSFWSSQAFYQKIPLMPNLLLLLFLRFFAPHPIHLSMMEVFEENQQVVFSVTLFADDFSAAIGYAEHAEAIQNGKTKTNDLIIKYLKSKLKLKVNGKPINYSLSRTESTHETITCILKPNPAQKEVSKIEISNELMLELFDDQRNMVQARIPGKKEGALQLNKKTVTGVMSW